MCEKISWCLYVWFSFSTCDSFIKIICHYVWCGQLTESSRSHSHSHSNSHSMLHVHVHVVWSFAFEHGQSWVTPKSQITTFVPSIMTMTIFTRMISKRYTWLRWMWCCRVPILDPPTSHIRHLWLIQGTGIMSRVMCSMSVHVLVPNSSDTCTAGDELVWRWWRMTLLNPTHPISYSTKSRHCE